MIALSSYDPKFEAGLRSSVNYEFGPKGQVEGVFANPTPTGTFILFRWADWPSELERKLFGRVEQFQEDHPYLRQIKGGSPEWNRIFEGSVSDREAADKIAEIFREYMGSGPSWVRSERGPGGRLRVWVGLKGGGSIDFCLSKEKFAVGGIGCVDFVALGSAIGEIHQWDATRFPGQRLPDHFCNEREEY